VSSVYWPPVRQHWTPATVRSEAVACADTRTTTFLLREHPAVCVEESKLVRRANVADDERSLVHPPEPFAAGEKGELGDLDGGEAKHFASGLRLLERFVVQDASRGVPEQPLCETTGLRADVAHGFQIR
jgi:hypothetical protein